MGDMALPEWYFEEVKAGKMLAIIFTVCLIWVIGKLLFLGIKAAWSITKLLITIVIFPVILIWMAAAGMVYAGLLILIIVGIATLISSKS